MTVTEKTTMYYTQFVFENWASQKPLTIGCSIALENIPGSGFTPVVYIPVDRELSLTLEEAVEPRFNLRKVDSTNSNVASAFNCPYVAYTLDTVREVPLSEKQGNAYDIGAKERKTGA